MIDHDAAMRIADSWDFSLESEGGVAGEPPDIYVLARAYKDVVRDAERWKAMKPLLVGLDFAWGDPPMSVAAFVLPEGRFGADADVIADAAIAARAATTKEAENG